MSEDKSKNIDWDAICSEVASKMREHVLPFSTPISKVLSDDHGEHHGSAYYVFDDNFRFLLTNEHVARAASKFPLTHKFWDCEDIFRVTNAWITVSAPIDSAVTVLKEEVWNHSAHKAHGITLDRFEERHAPIDNELLFFAGYSGERSKFYFESLFTTGTPYLTQQIPVPEGIPEADAKFHFALPYKPDLAVSVDGKSSLPKPPGFSGSLVWDTKRVACLKNQQMWSPELAKVTGIVWGWPSSQGCILATKIEHIEIKSLLGLAKEYA